jgi:hypothetical protein
VPQDIGAWIANIPEFGDAVRTEAASKTILMIPG